MFKIPIKPTPQVMEHVQNNFFPGLYTKYLRFNGWLTLTNYKKSTKFQEILSLIPMLITISLGPPYIIFQIISFFNLKYDLATSTEIICMILPLILSQTKMFTFLCHRRDIRDLLQLLNRNTFLFSSKTRRARGNEILEKFIRKTNSFVVIFIVLELLPMTAWQCIPLISSGNQSGNSTTVNKFLPGWYPWDYSQFPGYHIAVIYETAMACFNSFYMINSNVLFYQLTLMLCGHIAVLTEGFESLKEFSNPETSITDILGEMETSFHNNIFKSSLSALMYEDEEISKCLRLHLKNHQKVVRLSKILNKVYSVFVAADILLGLFLICLILFQLTSVPEKQSLADIIKSLTFLSSAACYIFIMCWLGSELEKMSNSLQNGVFNSDWPSWPQGLNRMLPTVLLTTSRPLTLSAGHIYSANLELFTSTMRFAYSFYTVLVNMQRIVDLGKG